MLEKIKRNIQFDPFEELLNREILSDEPSTFETAILRPPNNPAAVLSLRSPTVPDNAAALSLGYEPKADTPQRLTRNETMKKYALFSEMAYSKGNAEKINKMVRESPLLDGFVFDGQLSGPKNQVFYNRRTGEVVLAYKGTDPRNAEDLSNDYAILHPLLDETKTDRFKRADELYGRVVDKYGSDVQVKSVGHSLGGEIAMVVGERHDLETHAYNPGVSANQAFNTHSKHNKNKTYIYRTENDPVSFGSYINQNDQREIITVEQKHLFDSHSITNFTQDKADPSRAALDKIESTADHIVENIWNVATRAVVKTAHDELIPAEIQENEGFVDKATNELVDILKSDTRRNQDKLMELAASQKVSTDIETDIHDNIVTKNGVRYTQVMGTP